MVAAVLLGFQGVLSEEVALDLKPELWEEPGLANIQGRGPQEGNEAERQVKTLVREWQAEGQGLNLGPADPKLCCCPPASVGKGWVDRASGEAEARRAQVWGSKSYFLVPQQAGGLIPRQEEARTVLTHPGLQGRSPGSG